jgi:hypothetical protein
MTERSEQLHATATGQIDELIALLSTADEATLRRRCPGREKLGDGTVAANARHTADNYQRIAAFAQTSDSISHAREPSRHGAHRIPPVRRLRHGPAEHVKNGPGANQHGIEYTADNVDIGTVVKQLSTSRDTLGQITKITASQRDAIPPRDSFRFCDGRRTLEQVLASLLKHQSHQIEALKEALT